MTVFLSLSNENPSLRCDMKDFQRAVCAMYNRLPSMESYFKELGAEHLNFLDLARSRYLGSGYWMYRPDMLSGKFDQDSVRLSQYKVFGTCRTFEYRSLPLVAVHHGRVNTQAMPQVMLKSNDWIRYIQSVEQALLRYETEGPVTLDALVEHYRTMPRLPSISPCSSLDKSVALLHSALQVIATDKDAILRSKNVLDIKSSVFQELPDVSLEIIQSILHPSEVPAMQPFPSIE